MRTFCYFHKEYKYTEKSVQIKGKKYNGIFPEKHSVIDGLIFEVVDENADDTWANIPDYHTFCAIKRKGEKKWEIIFEGKSYDFEVNGIKLGTMNGIYDALFELEDKNIRDKTILDNEIVFLKKRIKEDTKRLKELKHVDS
jgi:hypothetical protein